MTDSDARDNGTSAQPPPRVIGDQKRQAVPSFQGFYYQALSSVEAWLMLSREEVVYLEGAEDLDITTTTNSVTVQVKHQQQPISLGDQRAHQALQNYWSHVERNPNTTIQYHYVTTGSIANERDTNFSGYPGLVAWSAARTNEDIAAQISSYLSTKLPKGSSLHFFLEHSPISILQERLFKRVYWFTEQEDTEGLLQSINNRIHGLLRELRASTTLVKEVRNALLVQYLDVVTRPNASDRCLSFGMLWKAAEEATHIFVPMTRQQISDALLVQHAASDPLVLFLEQEVPAPPSPLLDRPDLIRHVETLCDARVPVLLTGSVFKGKTTLAQLSATKTSGSTLWISVSDQPPTLVTTILSSLADRLEQYLHTFIVVIDDLDISPAPYRIYRHALASLHHRAKLEGIGLLVTARGNSYETADINHFKDFSVIDVPPIGTDELLAICVAHGCPTELAESWSALIYIWTTGHPKLVQVVISDLSNRAWPSPSQNDLLKPPDSVTSARQIARHLLSQTVDSATAEYVYTVSESSTPLERNVLLSLGNSIQGLRNAGDVLDGLVGSWIERINDDHFQVTVLLKQTAKDVWSEPLLRQAHKKLHDAILTKRTLSQYDAAALLFHAFLARDNASVAIHALRFQMTEDPKAQVEIEKQLSWLPFVALDEGQQICPGDSVAGTSLRSLQFRVAYTLDSETLPKIYDRWREEIERIDIQEIKDACYHPFLWRTAMCSSRALDLSRRLRSLNTFLILRDTRSLPAQFEDDFPPLDIEEIPASCTFSQFALLSAAPGVDSQGKLTELIEWLDDLDQPEIRDEFDSMLDWPLVQSLGAFVQGAWASHHQETKDWASWLPILDMCYEYSERRASPNLAREVAKAKAIILTEYLDRSEEALTILDSTREQFGSSTILLEQRANVLFQNEDDERVLSLWSELTEAGDDRRLDPYAHRRAAVSAGRLGQWALAVKYFSSASEVIGAGELEKTNFGLLVDASYAAYRNRDLKYSLELLGKGVSTLPPEANAEGDEHWEALHRVALSLSTHVHTSIWGAVARTESDSLPLMEPGYASSPFLRAPKTTPGQEARHELLYASVYKTCMSINAGIHDVSAELNTLSNSRFLVVRWYACQGLLATFYRHGPTTGFVPALLDFDSKNRQMIDSHRASENLASLLIEPTETTQEAHEKDVNWFGLLVAGVCCSGSDLLSSLDTWLEEARSRIRPDNTLGSQIELIGEGAVAPLGRLDTIAREVSEPLPLRVGAATRRLLEENNVSDTFYYQYLLCCAMITDESRALQALFNYHVAKRFSVVWNEYAQRPFLLSSPRVTVPMIDNLSEKVTTGTGTLRTLLRTGAAATGEQLRQDVLDHLW